MVTLWLTCGVGLLALLGEWLHSRRVARAAHLLFGPSGRARAWVRAVPVVRWFAATLLAWGLATLLAIVPKVHLTGQVAEEDWRHLVMVLDVSPSMLLRDAGGDGGQSRSERSHDLIKSLFDRVPIGRFKISVIATYNGAKVVVEDTKDIELVHHLMTEVDMRYAFTAGTTKLFDGIAEAARLGRTWRTKSAMLVIVSDGDTVPATGMPELPPAFGGTLVIGVGDHVSGRFIAGHQSRQDTSTLRQLAIRLGGEFHNGNRQHVPSDILAVAAADARKPLLERLTLREYALLASAIGSLLLASLPLLRYRLGVPGLAQLLPQPKR